MGNGSITAHGSAKRQRSILDFYKPLTPEQMMAMKGNDLQASDEKVILPNVAPVPAPSRHTKKGFHPILKQNRLAVRGKNMFALYPMGKIRCSRHRDYQSATRNHLCAHVASRDHLNLDDVVLIYVCDTCHISYLDVRNMKKHFDDEHRDRANSSTTTTNLQTVCANLISETDEVCNPALKFPLDSPGVLEISKHLHYSSHVKDLLGTGSGGTEVYKGLFEKRFDVAVKCVLIGKHVDAMNEIEHLRPLENKNIVRYYVTERVQKFMYIAITLAEASLHDYIKQRAKYPEIVINDLKIFKDCCKGLSYLHNNSENEWTLHRDIKPHNILLTRTSGGESKAMLSDFGIAKKFSSEATQTRSRTRETKGTMGWIAPEVLNGGEHTRFSDVFSMGCVAFFIYSGGQHPFGDENIRVHNIEKAKQPNMRPVAKVDIGIYSVIHSMLSDESASRPPIIAVLKHPIFWTTKKKLDFLVDFCKGMKPKDPEDPIRKSLEVDAHLVLNRTNWKGMFCESIIKDLDFNRKEHPFSGDSVHDLVRAIRNKTGHYGDSKEEFRMILGGTEEEMFEYFSSKFPRLIYHCYVVAQGVPQVAHYYSGSGFLFPPLPKMPEHSVKRSLSSGKLEVHGADSLSHGKKASVRKKIEWPR